jgi:nitrogen fixation protein NifQ
LPAAARDDEVDDLIGLLIEHGSAAAGSRADIAMVPRPWPLACLGDNHLWQDLQLPSRASCRH